ITYMNRMAEEMTNISFLEARGCPIEEVVRFTDYPLASKASHPVYQVLDHGKPLHPIAHHIIRSASTGERPVIFSASPIQGKEGHMLGVVLILRDMTEHLQLEQELLKASKLESLSLLAGGIA
ncbi:MAG: PAS domain-containing protein, partial [Nitrospira sp.]|nr:PAS domain-containing protein [Nitrospira sp.]